MTGEHKVRGKYKVTGRHGEQCDREPDRVDRVDQWSNRGGYLTLLGRCTSYVVYDLDGVAASRQETLSLFQGNDTLARQPMSEISEITRQCIIQVRCSRNREDMAARCFG